MRAAVPLQRAYQAGTSAGRGGYPGTGYATIGSAPRKGETLVSGAGVGPATGAMDPARAPSIEATLASHRVIPAPSAIRAYCRLRIFLPPPIGRRVPAKLSAWVPGHIGAHPQNAQVLTLDGM